MLAAVSFFEFPLSIGACRWIRVGAPVQVGSEDEFQGHRFLSSRRSAFLAIAPKPRESARPFLVGPASLIASNSDERLSAPLQSGHIVLIGFFVRPGVPFLRPDPQYCKADARRSCQGWPTPQPCGVLRPRRAAAARSSPMSPSYLKSIAVGTMQMIRVLLLTPPMQ